MLGIGFPYLGDLGSLESTFFPPTWRKKIVTFAPREVRTNVPWFHQTILEGHESKSSNCQFCGGIFLRFFREVKNFKKKSMSISQPKTKKTKKCSSPPKMCWENPPSRAFIYRESGWWTPVLDPPKIFFSPMTQGPRPPGLPTTYWPKAVQKRPRRKKMAP